MYSLTFRVRRCRRYAVMCAVVSTRGVMLS